MTMMPPPMTRRDRGFRAIAVVAALVMVMAACSGDSDDESGGGTTTSTPDGVASIPPPPEPEEVELERLPVPPVPAGGRCDLTENPQGCVTAITQVGGFIDATTQLPHHRILRRL